jgi:flagellar hook assembly protein FlgD
MPVTLTWDGTNNSSTVVTPGIYNIEVHWNNGSGQTTDVSRQIMVIENTNISGIAVAKPNVLGTNSTMTTTFDVSGVLNASSFKVRIYTTTGELVQTLYSSATTTTWNVTGLASGIYIANVEMYNANSGVIGRQFLKVLVIH